MSLISSLKDELGIVQTDTSQDPRLYRLINAASQYVESYVGRPLAYAAAQTDTLYGDGRVWLGLTLWPIWTVAAASIDGLAVTDYTIFSDTGMLYRAGGWTWRPGIIPDLTADPDPNAPNYNVSVTYAGGYLLPQYSQPGTLTNGQTIVTSLGDTAAIQSGWYVFGTGIPPGATVLSVDAASQIHLNVPATSSGVQMLTFSATSTAPPTSRLPFDIEQAALLMAAFDYFHQPGVRVERFPTGYTYERSDREHFMDVDIHPRLNKWKRWI